MDDKVTVLSVGDLILDVPGVDSYFDESRALLQSGDVVIGQVEIPYTTNLTGAHTTTTVRLLRTPCAWKQ